VGAAECQDLATELTADDAFLIVEPYYLAVQEIFLAAGLMLTKRTRLYCAPWVHDSPRHFAACRDDGRGVVVAPELAELDEGIVLAVMAHELGHATDFLYPGRYALGKERKVLERKREDFTDAQWARWIKSWEKRDHDATEMTADAIAEAVTGHRIGYVGPCQLQCFDAGKARPQGLR